MFITPMKPAGSIAELSRIGTGQPETKDTVDAGIFQDIFQSTLNNVVDTDKDLVQKQYLLSTGQMDDPHAVPAAAAMAQMSVDMLVQLRNRTLESYSELMRINL